MIFIIDLFAKLVLPASFFTSSSSNASKSSINDFFALLNVSFSFSSDHVEGHFGVRYAITFDISIVKGLESKFFQGIFTKIFFTDPHVRLKGKPKICKISLLRFKFSKLTTPLKRDILSCSEFKFSIQSPRNLLSTFDITFSIISTALLNI